MITLLVFPVWSASNLAGPFSNASDGHQIDVVAGGATVKVEVVSQDQTADHTYTIVVTLDNVISRYDRDGNGVIDKEEAIVAYFGG